MNQVIVRVYGPLNDFLPAARRQVDVPVGFMGPRSVKDVIEGLGVPHPEIDLILVNGESVPFDATVEKTDRIAVFPRFHALDITPVTRVRPDAPETVRFVLDGHLGKLARRLRLLGLDASSPTGARDNELAQLADRERRILLTRDRELLKHGLVRYGYCVRETDPQRQLVEVLQRFRALPLEPFSRCLCCNTLLHEISKAVVEATLPPRIRERHEHFLTCSSCGRLYWQGSHWTRLAHAVNAALDETRHHVA